MSKQTINLGTAPTGSGGDDSRSAMVKINTNFDELYAAFGGNTLPSNSAAKYPITGTVATGAVFERGSNANGEFIKFMDGTMICWATAVVTSTIAANTYGGNVTTFPSTFVNGTYTVTATCVPVNSWDHFGVIGVVRTSGTQCNIFTRNGSTAQAFHLAYIAVGRWN